MIDVLRYIEKMKEMYEGERITAQEPRNMYAGGQLVQNTADGSRPGYNGRRRVLTTKDKTNIAEYNKAAKERGKPLYNELENLDTQYRVRKQGANVGSKLKSSLTEYDQLVTEYKTYVDDLFAKEKLGNVQAWEGWVKNKTGRASPSFTYYATADNPVPSNYAYNKKI